MSYFEEIEPVWNPCPTCGEGMHPAMERRYGHCGGPYCSGWADALPDAPDHHAAMHGCFGTGEETAVGEHRRLLCELSWDGSPVWCRLGSDGHLWETTPEECGCTADDAVRAGGRR